MKRNRMRRFFQQKQYAIASLVLFAAIAAMTGVYVSNQITNERQEQELAQKEKELAESARQEFENNTALDSGNDPFVNQAKLPDQEEDVKSVTSVIQPQENTADPDKNLTETDTDKDTQKPEQKESDAATDEADQKKTPETAAENTKQNTTAHSKAAVSLNFSPESELGWPLQGDVILNYSMDQTVYFATLDQYKYNPALIIAGKVNDPVNAAATGKITDISANEETGLTVTMDLGNGYSAVYGQLKEVLYKEGATVEAGNAIGYVAEPTKYYSVEGSNLYFELLKDQEPVNPMQYMQ